MNFEKVDYEKKLRDYLNSDIDQMYKNMLLNLFPELKESGDERVWLTKFIQEEIDCIRFDIRDYEDRIKLENLQRSLAWLEKQGEQNPTGNKGMDLVEEKMTPFQKKVFCIVDTTIEEEQGLSNICNELLALAKQETEQKPWSEEDDQYLLICKNALAKYQVSDKWDATIISRWLEDKLKSLRPQTTWKPSDRELGAMLTAIGDERQKGSDVAKELQKIYQQLKKLREE